MPLVAIRALTLCFWLALVWTLWGVASCLGAASRIGSGDSNLPRLAAAALVAGPLVMGTALALRLVLGRRRSKDSRD